MLLPACSFFSSLLLALFLVAMPATAAQASDPIPEDIEFEVYRGGDSIGHHRVAFRREGEDLHVEIDIELEVKLAFLTLFSYSHRNHEVWNGGQLKSLESRTDDNGTIHQVTGSRMAAGFLVQNGKKEFVAPAGILPTSYWNPATVDQKVLLDTQSGRLVEVDIRPLGREPLPIDGASLPVQKYAVTGDLTMDLWYSALGEWSKIAFSARGADVEYLRPANQAAQQPASPSQK